MNSNVEIAPISMWTSISINRVSIRLMECWVDVPTVIIDRHSEIPNVTECFSLWNFKMTVIILVISSEDLTHTCIFF